MDCYIKLPTYKTTKRLIWTFFENDFTVFHEHLELHQSEWNDYLLELANIILLEDVQINRDVLKCRTLYSDQMSEQQFELSFPRNKNTNSMESIWLFVESDKDKRSVQFENNSSPIGPYMGPYDQSDCNYQILTLILNSILNSTMLMMWSANCLE